MRLAGFLLLLAGWAVVLAALAMLRETPAQALGTLAGMAVEAAGLVMVFRSHRIRREGRR